MRRLLIVAVLGSVGWFACQKAEKEPGKQGAAPPTTGDIESKDVLARTKTFPEVEVKHVLFGWKDLAAAYRGQMDPRAANRTQAEAEKLARDTAAKLKAKPDQIDAVMKELSEDPGSKEGTAYNVKPSTQFVPEFKNLALRLEINEVGIVKTNYGFHVMLRVPPPPPPPLDPLESADILARPAPSEQVTSFVQHVLVSWKEAPGARDPRAQARTKADADKLAKEILDKVNAGGDMPALMKEFSEDPGSKDTARVYEVTPTAGMVEPFKNLSLRLKEGEAGVVKTQFGWHVIKRIPPPPPDPIESADILAREPRTQKAKVKHILLGWTAAHTDDERGKKRDRATLEKLVKATVAKLKKGAKIEALMAELSEDPGSAKSGTAYDATPDAGLVAPFKNLALRLDVNEVGVVKTDFGVHIIQRVE